MEASAKVYDITTPPVDMAGQYWLAIAITLVLVALAIACFEWEYRKGSKDKGTFPWRGFIGVPILMAIVLGPINWMITDASDTLESAVNRNLEVQISEAADLHRVTPINGTQVEDGFVAIDSDSNTVVGEVRPFEENDHYQVTIEYFK